MTSSRTLAKRRYQSVNIGHYTITGIMMSDDDRKAIFCDNKVPTLTSDKAITREMLRKHIIKYRPDLIGKK